VQNDYAHLVVLRLRRPREVPRALDLLADEAGGQMKQHDNAQRGPAPSAS